jgi:predicted permease
MSWRRHLARIGTLILWRKPVDGLDEEIRAHVEMEERENLEAGMPPDEAHFAALRRFGNVTQTQERSREMWKWQWLETLLQDLRYGLRQLRRNPGFTAVAVITLALGIGATTALFTVVRSVLLEPLPYRNPGRLISLYEQSSDGKFAYNTVAGGVFAAWKNQNHAFSDLAIFSFAGERSLSGAGGELPETVRVLEASASLFPTLGVEPALGRTFTAADDSPSANGTAVLSWGFWKRRFGGDPSAIGRAIDLDAKPYTILGVMPPWFTFPDASTQLWTPIYHEEKSQEMQAIDSHDFSAIGRLRPGVSEKEATAQLSVIVRRLHDQHLDDPFVSIAANSRPLLEAMVGEIRTPLYILFAATGCLLLIACLNVASLMVARGAARSRELAIRSALGGSRWRLLRQHLAETLLLSAVGGALGTPIAFGMIRWLVAMRPDMSRVDSVHMDQWIVLFVLGLIFGTAFFSCFVSSLSVRARQIFNSLRESSRSQSAGHGRVKLRKVLLIVEVGLTVVLLVGAGLLLKSYAMLRGANLGCITKDVLTMHINLPVAKYSKGVQRVNFFETLLERVRALPGVKAAGLVRIVPGQGYGGDAGFTVAEHPPLPLGKAQYAIVRWADPGYFAALGIPFLRGQTFDENQKLQAADEAIISESFARRYFPGENPLGKHLITMGHRSFRIVGVVGDTRYLVSQPVRPMMYFPTYGSLYGGVVPFATLVVRTDRNVLSTALPIQRIIQRLDPNLAVADILTMDQVIGRSVLDASFDATLMLAFAMLSLMLAAVGLFGVVSYIVSQRIQEIGIRIALGAQKSDVLRLVIGQGMTPALLGLGAGIIGALVLTKFLRSLLYGLEPTDPLTFIAVSLILIVVALVACYIPARRASKVDPMVALRYE